MKFYCRFKIFGKKNPYCYSDYKTESLLVFFSKVFVVDIVNTVRSTDVTQYAALNLRKALLNLDS